MLETELDWLIARALRGSGTSGHGEAVTGELEEVEMRRTRLMASWRVGLEKERSRIGGLGNFEVRRRRD